MYHEDMIHVHVYTRVGLDYSYQCSTLKNRASGYSSPPTRARASPPAAPPRPFRPRCWALFLRETGRAVGKEEKTEGAGGVSGGAPARATPIGSRSLDLIFHKL